jgi:DNA-binding SARP family transcriptional activator/Tfp pilus assembly protein PilF
LRKALGDEQRILHSPGGYSVVVAPDELDITRFRSLIEAGRDAWQRGKPAQADRLLTEALGLWRGRPFADLDQAEVILEATRLLEEQWLSAHELRAGVRLDLRRHQEVITDLSGLLPSYPYQERLASYLMLALYRSDRQSEALEVYRRTREQFADELGIEPGATMAWLQQAILRSDTRLWQIGSTDLEKLSGTPAPTGSAATTAVTQSAPAQLPPDVYGFTGRGSELASLDAAIAAGAERPTAVVISAMSGTAGVGKTALAVHWAHRVRDRFPDGQLYVNLRGFDHSGKVMDPAEAVRRFLDALAVPSQRIPADPGAQADLYRTLLANRCMLVVLDNARDPDQVRPLLPGAPGCYVLVTSRNRLTSLIAAEGAHALSLDLLTVEEAHDLLTRRLGAARVAAEPDAANEVINCCARLPLALAIVAAHAKTHPQLSLTGLAGQLRDSRNRLAMLATGDTAVTDVRAVFSWSYETLTDDSARLFRLLGLHPGPDVSVAAAASLAALPVERVRLLLNELAGVHLVSEQVPGRYTLHDLLRAYAADLADSTDAEEERGSAMRRIVGHYLKTAYAADRLLDPARDPIDTEPSEPGTTPEDLAGHEQAFEWFTAEHAVLLAVMDLAVSAELDAHAWQLAWALYDFLHLRGHWHDQLRIQRAAVGAGHRLADSTAEARARRSLANALAWLGDLDAARAELQLSLDLTIQAGDRVRQAHTHHVLAYVLERQGDSLLALHHAQQSLDLQRATGHRPGQALALNAVGWYHALLGNYQESLNHCQQALALHQELGNRSGQADTWDSLGYAYGHLGRHTEALVCYQRALGLFRELGDRYGEAEALAHLGDAHNAAGDCDIACTSWQDALTIFEQLNHPDAEQIRIKLSKFDQTGTP